MAHESTVRNFPLLEFVPLRPLFPSIDYQRHITKDSSSARCRLFGLCHCFALRQVVEEINVQTLCSAHLAKVGMLLGQNRNRTSNCFPENDVISVGIVPQWSKQQTV